MSRDAEPKSWIGGLRVPFDRSRPQFPAGTPFWKDSNFDRLLDRCPPLRPMRGYLPSDLGTTAFRTQQEIEAIPAAYQEHGYGLFLYSLARVLKPERCVELGVYQGFSLLCVAAALRDNGAGRIDGFDLFDDYPYRHEPLANVAQRIESLGLAPWATVVQADAAHVHERIAEVDYLHVDLSNDGDVYRSVFANWAAKVRSAIVLEGGSEPRDRVDWMSKYGKTPIVPALAGIRECYPDWEITVLEPFPSLAVAVRR